MALSVSALVALARSPRRGAAAVLRSGTLPVALGLVAMSLLLSALVAQRVSQETRLDELLFGTQTSERLPAVDLLLGALGPQRTAVILYLVQRSFDAVVVATAATPLFLWLLGSSAVQAAARLSGITRPYVPLLVLFGYATALTRVPADLATLALGVGRGAGPAVAGLVGTATLVWFGLIAFEAIRAHYAVAAGRALVILVVAIVLFYLVPLVLIVAAALAIVVAAVILEYF